MTNYSKDEYPKDAETTILDLLEPLSDDERVVIFNEIKAHYCIDCGSLDGPDCYCMRDE